METNTGRYYFFNPITRVSQWTQPEDLIFVEETEEEGEDESEESEAGKRKFEDGEEKEAKVAKM